MKSVKKTVFFLSSTAHLLLSDEFKAMRCFSKLAEMLTPAAARPSRGRPAHADGGHVPTAPLQSQRRPHHPALLAALPLHQHVALQQAGDGHGVRALLPLLGGHTPAAAQPHRGLGRKAGLGARR